MQNPSHQKTGYKHIVKRYTEKWKSEVLQNWVLQKSEKAER